MMSSPVNAPFLDPKQHLRFKVQSQSSSSTDWIGHLSSSPFVSLLSAYIHSSSVSKCKLSISPICAFSSSTPSAVQVCGRRVPRLQCAHRPPFLSGFLSPLFSERMVEILWSGRTRLSGGLNSSKRGWTSRPLHRGPFSVGEHQVGDGGLQPVS